MSIILKGIDIPQKLYTDIRIYKDGRIKKIIGENIMISYNKNAEAIQIPKGHGRLIDGDELVKHLRKDPLFDLVERYGISGVIESRPTILDKESE